MGKTGWSEPLVSVVMAVYNEEQYVGSAMESVLAQSYRNIELIVIDDRSTDQSLDICSGFDDPRVRVYQKGPEGDGAAISRNIGVRLAAGQYIAIHDADDLSHPQRIEKQLSKLLENPAKRVVGCLTRRVDGHKEHVPELPEHHDQIVKGFTRIFNRSTIVAGTILAPRELFLAFPYRDKFKLFEDWDLLLRLYESTRVEFYNVQEPLYTYFIREKGVLFRPEYSLYNVFERNCQERRRKGLNEFDKVEEFIGFLRHHPFAYTKWMGLKGLIEMQLRLKGIRP